MSFLTGFAHAARSEQQDVGLHPLLVCLRRLHPALHLHHHQESVLAGDFL